MLGAVSSRTLNVWIFGQDAVVRFKKMDEDGRTANYPTEQAKDFDAGNVLLDLPPEAVRLSVGYFTDPTATKIEYVMVSRPMGKRSMWCSAIVLTEEARWIDITRQATMEEYAKRRRKK